jgi:hypothetical protein
MMRASHLTADGASKITDRIGIVLKCNEKRLKLEKLFRDNGFEVDLVEGKMDPGMVNLFPGSGINFLEQSSQLLADNPWINEMDLLGPSEQFVRLRRASKAHDKVTNLLGETIRNFDKISPQPSEEEINLFQADVISEHSAGGTYWLTNQGRIGNFTDQPGSFLVDGLLHHLRITFPITSGTVTYIKLSSLGVAVVIRSRMKKMMEQALEADKEREEKRKVPAE